ncbi:hypothetical protein CDD81_3180 [Ophiocordyceps australis]|uniref:Peptidase S8/S53 domain-containing protein n=1 Tax=Ophiocordyceps australis TaxID=1399860 RepID=A0A2C5XWG3_9HYPO|nr:hypothetical protein CDD81_3180 [Ophiocordyceps australis]
MKSWISLVLWATFLLLGLGQSLPYDDSNPSCSNFNVDENGIIRSSYIVALRPELTDEQVEEHIRWVEDMSRGHGIIEQRFRIGDFRGYSGYFDDYAIQAIRDSQQQVKYVEANSIVVNSAVETQTNAPWGLGRLSSQVTQRSMDPLALSHTYKYESSAGQDTWAYVIDSGVNTNHPDFQGRARFGAACCSFRCFEEEKYRNMHADHGTHVAGIVGGAQFGVAKRANIVSVKALWSSNEVGGGAAPATGIIAAIQWSLDDMEKNGRLGRSVINLSLGKASLEDAVKGAFKKGVLSVKGAGNQGLPAEWERPHGQDSVLTVGAIDHTGREWASSNYGKAIDILAPGVDIKSADSQNGVKLMSGTSMATPHITGLALNILALENIKSPRELKQRILSLAVSDVTPLDRGEKGRGSGIPRPVLTTVRRAYNGIDALQSQGSGQNGQQLTCPVPPQGVDLVNPGPSTSGQQQDRGSFWGPPTGSATYKHTGGYGSFSDQVRALILASHSVKIPTRDSHRLFVLQVLPRSLASLNGLPLILANLKAKGLTLDNFRAKALIIASHKVKALTRASHKVCALQVLALTLANHRVRAPTLVNHKVMALTRASRKASALEVPGLTLVKRQIKATTVKRRVEILILVNLRARALIPAHSRVKAITLVSHRVKVSIPANPKARPTLVNTTPKTDDPNSLMRLDTPPSRSRAPFTLPIFQHTAACSFFVQQSIEMIDID